MNSVKTKANVGYSNTLLMVPSLVTSSWKRLVRGVLDENENEEDQNATMAKESNVNSQRKDGVDENSDIKSRNHEDDDDDDYTLANEYFADNPASDSNQNLNSNPKPNHDCYPIIITTGSCDQCDLDFADLISAEYEKAGRPRNEEVASDFKRTATEVLLSAYDIVDLDGPGTSCDLATHVDDDGVIHVSVPTTYTDVDHRTSVQ